MKSVTSIFQCQEIYIGPLLNQRFWVQTMRCKRYSEKIRGLRMKRHKSPCISICEFSGPNGWCLGCGRTRRECQKWKKMKPYERNILDKKLIKRMAEILKSWRSRSRIQYSYRTRFRSNPSRCCLHYSEGLIYLTDGIFGARAAGILWMTVRGDYKDANVGRWLGVLGIIALLFLVQALV